ncbi:unnamed protein product, partial [Choristocarpus tenellus]
MEKVSTGGNDKPRLPVAIDDCGQVGEVVEEGMDLGMGEDSVQSSELRQKQQGVGGEVEGEGAGAGEEGKVQGGEEAEVAVEEEEEEVEELDVETLGKMTSRERRLFEIRLKMNKACTLGGRANKKAVKEEYQRFTDKGYAAKLKSKEKEE